MQGRVLKFGKKRFNRVTEVVNAVMGYNFIGIFKIMIIFINFRKKKELLYNK